MSTEIEIPEWFDWYKAVGKVLASRPNKRPGSKALRVFISAPNVDFAQWALVSGALDSVKSPALTPAFGDRVVSWVDSKMKDGILRESPGAHARIRIGGIGLPSHWPMAYVPDGTPENRTPRGLGDDEKKMLRKTYGRTGWYPSYTSICVLPVSLIGNRTEQTAQRDYLLEHCPTWFSETQEALLGVTSAQIGNPNKFQYFPVGLFSPQVSRTRPWLRQMESRLVVSSSFSAYKALDPYYQMGTPHVVLVDRRGWNSIDAHQYVDEQLEIEKGTSLQLPKAPQGVFVRAYEVRVTKDPGHVSTEDDIEDWEL